MSRKRFIIWGLGIIHAYLIVWAIGLYLTFSMVLPKDIFFTHLSFLFFCTLFFGFGALLWRRFETIGRRKRALAWCALFYVVSWLFTVICIAPYAMDFIINETANDKFFDHIYTWKDNGGIGSLWTPLQKIEYIFFGQMPSRYFGIWPLFALLWFGSRDPKAPKSFWQKTKRLIKRTPKQTPLQADPILVNGAW